MGRPGLVEGTRELLETPYIIVYSVDEAAGVIEVIIIVQGAGSAGLIGNAETAGLEAPQNLPFIQKVLRTGLPPRGRFWRRRLQPEIST
jgi:hypothetical protein